MSIFSVIKKVNLWKTLYFNFRYLPFTKAIHLPVYIYWRSDLSKMRGKLIIDAPVTAGMIKFGVHSLGHQDSFFNRTKWDVRGTVVFKGEARIGRGSKICVGKGATLTLGDGFDLTGASEIICQKEITFGSQCLLSWDILIMDTDFHHVLNAEDQIINSPKPITIGNHVWIGCRNTILKGVSVADDTIISANSTITRSITEPHCAVAGHGRHLDILKSPVTWTL